jgi:hypothetical protein
VESKQTRERLYQDFQENVNMAPSELVAWLDGEQSQSVGWDKGDGESVGHASGREIVRIKRTKKADLTEQDYEHMQKVVGYVRRHLAQRPSGDVADTRWRYSLMNWGHDPLK